MKRTFPLVAVAVVVAASAAQAGPVYSSSLVNGSNTLKDQSIEQFFDQDNDGYVSGGDVILSVLRIDDAIPSGALYSNALYVVASQQVKAGTIQRFPIGLSNIYQWYLEPTTIGVVDTTTGGTGNGLDILALTGLATPVSGSPMAALFEQSGGFGVNAITADPGDVDSSGVVDIFDFVAYYSAGTPNVLAGFDPSNPADFLANQTSTVMGSASPIGKGPTVALLSSTGSGINLLSFSGGMSVLTNYDPQIEYHRLAVVNDVTTGDLSIHDIGISGGVVSGSAGDLSGAYQPTNRDSQDFLINVTVVPEPTSLALYGFGALILAGSGYRRRRRDIQSGV